MKLVSTPNTRWMSCYSYTRVGKYSDSWSVRKYGQLPPAISIIADRCAVATLAQLVSR